MLWKSDGIAANPPLRGSVTVFITRRAVVGGAALSAVGLLFGVRGTRAIDLTSKVAAACLKALHQAGNPIALSALGGAFAEGGASLRNSGPIVVEAARSLVRDPRISAALEDPKMLLENLVRALHGGPRKFLSRSDFNAEVERGKVAIAEAIQQQPALVLAAKTDAVGSDYFANQPRTPFGSTEAARSALESITDEARHDNSLALAAITVAQSLAPLTGRNLYDLDGKNV